MHTTSYPCQKYVHGSWSTCTCIVQANYRSRHNSKYIALVLGHMFREVSSDSMYTYLCMYLCLYMYRENNSLSE